MVSAEKKAVLNEMILSCPVTAMTSVMTVEHGEITFSACGHSVNVFTHGWGQLKFVNKVNVMHAGQKIHLLKSYAANDGDVHIVAASITGAKMCKMTSAFAWTVMPWQIEVADRIIDLSVYFDENKIEILTGYNSILHYNLTSNDLTTGPKWDGRSILYSGLICRPYIIAGTVSCDVLVWTAKQGVMPRVNIRLEGHKGSIFAVDFEPEQRLIASGSDDRTVRIWQLYGDVEFSLKIDCVHTIASSFHPARVFTCKIFKSYVAGELHLVSGGEDGCLNVFIKNKEWMWQGKRSGQASIRTVLVAKSSKSVLTAGDDGRIIWHQLCTSHSSLELRGKQIVSSADIPLDFVKSIATLDSSHAFCLHDSGHLSVVNEFGTAQVFEGSPSIARSHHLAVVRLTECVWQIVVVCSNQIDICMFSLSKLVNKIWTCQKLIATSGQLKRVLTREIQSKITNICHTGSIVCISHVNLQVEFFKLDECQYFPVLDLSDPGDWITSFDVSGQTTLVTGSRRGNVIVHFDNKTTISNRLHDKSGVSQIKCCSRSRRGETQETTTAIFISAGRGDGLLKLSTFDVSTLRVLETRRLPFKRVELFNSDVARLYVDMIVVGFRADKLVVHSTETGAESHVVCGGGQRAWNLSLENCDQSDQYSFFYVKDKRLMHCNVPKAGQTALATPHPVVGHFASMINVVKFTSDSTLVTGDEDGDIRVHKLDGQTGLSTEIIQPRKHLSSIKDLVVAKKENDNIIFSCGGRSQIVITQIDSHAARATVLNSMHLASTRVSRKCWRDPDPDSQPDSRITCIAFDAASRTICCGDSAGKVYLVQACDSEFRDMQVTRHCFGRAFMFTSMTLVHNSTLLISTSTDGQVRFLDRQTMDEIYVPIDRDSTVHSVTCANNHLFVGDHGGSITCVQMEDGVRPTLVRQTFNHCHASAVTGLQFSEHLCTLISTSPDQRIKIWQYTDCRLQLTSSVITSVSDVQSLAISPSDKTKLIVCGMGMHIFDLSINDR